MLKRGREGIISGKKTTWKKSYELYTEDGRATTTGERGPRAVPSKGHYKKKKRETRKGVSEGNL